MASITGLLAKVGGTTLRATLKTSTIVGNVTTKVVTKSVKAAREDYAKGLVTFEEEKAKTIKTWDKVSKDFDQMGSKLSVMFD